jgi:hypothetical protein
MCRNALRFLVATLLLAAGFSANATYHLWRITQAFSSADGTVQYIELMAYSSGQQYVHGHTLVSTQGSTKHSFTIPTDLPADTAMTTDGGGYYGGGGYTTYRSMVIATQGFAALGVVTPDYIVPSGFLFTSGGTLNYAEGADTWTYPALPTDGKMALNRDGSTSVNYALNFNGMGGQVTVTAAAANTPGALSGLFWNSQESGWGIHFTQRRNIIFAAWYTYDANGNPKWYVASSCTMATADATSGTCNGTLYEVSGPQFFGTQFLSSMVSIVNAGTLAVTFTDANNASMSYTLGTQSRTVAITRQPISAGSVPGVDYTDLWWNSNESGWGMAIAQQGSVMFLAWYVYDNNGKPTWYVASACAVSGAGCSGALYKTVGPPFGPTFDPHMVQVTTAGTVSLTFSDANNGVLNYTVGGVTASKNITRQTF